MARRKLRKQFRPLCGKGRNSFKVTPTVTSSCSHAQEERARSKRHDLISDALPFGRLWYGEPNAVSNAIGYAKFYSRSNDAVIRAYDEAGNVIETHEHRAISKNRKKLYLVLDIGS